MVSVAVVGAGLAGLVVAQRLNKAANVTVFEKSRGAGGRIATRYADQFEFDHGAQFFTARTSEFKSFVASLANEGVVDNWRARFSELDRDRVMASRRWDDEYPHFVGIPRMNSIGRFVSRALAVRYDMVVSRLEREGGQWVVFDVAGSEQGRFDWVVLTAPAAQTAKLVEPYPKAVVLCAERKMRGCYALMLGFSAPVPLPWQAALVHRADVSWISVNSSKPGRKAPFTLVVHSTNAWADRHIEDPTDVVLAHMLDEASGVSGVDMRQAVHRQIHRWRYANIDRQTGTPSFIDDEIRLAMCGDWFVRGRIESAFLSATDVSRALLARL